jgi:hypothetical protein
MNKLKSNAIKNVNLLNEIIPDLINKFQDDPDAVMEDFREILEIMNSNKIQVSLKPTTLTGVNLFAS